MNLSAERKLYDAVRETYILLEVAATRVLQQFDLTLAQFDTLRLLSIDDGIRMGELGQRIFADNSKMTRIVDALAVRGLVERQVDPSDRRANLVCLTAAGASLRERAAAAHEAALRDSVAPLEELERLQTLLDALRQTLHAVLDS